MTILTETHWAMLACGRFLVDHWSVATAQPLVDLGMVELLPSDDDTALAECSVTEAGRRALQSLSGQVAVSV